jgi:hypothetical protein
VAGPVCGHVFDVGHLARRLPMRAVRHSFGLWGAAGLPAGARRQIGRQRRAKQYHHVKRGMTRWTFIDLHVKLTKWMERSRLGRHTFSRQL